MESLRSHWSLDESVVYLNHGAYGACPRAVQSRQAELRDELESQPVAFFERRYGELLDRARNALCRFVGADPEDVVPVSNATTGVNTVLRGLRLAAGDELLVTDHAYNACRNALDAVAEDARARVVVVAVPFPGTDAEALVERVLGAVTPNTRFALLDHVTSPTALVLPVQRLACELEARGVAVLVDGAHAPGMLDLDVEAIGASWYTGNGHKWLCAPRGAGFLWARPDRRDGLRPLVISHGANMPRPGRSRFHDEFDWTGTADPTPFLCLDTAIETVGGFVAGGWEEVRRHNRELVLAGRARLLDALGWEPPAPAEMIGSIASIALPPLAAAPGGPDPLQLRLREAHGIEVPLMNPPVSPCRVLRISAQLYNGERDYERLAEALCAELPDARPTSTPRVPV